MNQPLVAPDLPLVTCRASRRSGTAWAIAAIATRAADCGFAAARRSGCKPRTARCTPNPASRFFVAHPRAARCALVGIGEPGRQRPAIVVETRSDRSSRGARALARELRELAMQHEQRRRSTLFYFRERFPVDVRHNAKIHRLTLARWAAPQRRTRAIRTREPMFDEQVERSTDLATGDDRLAGSTRRPLAPPGRGWSCSDNFQRATRVIGSPVRSHRP